MYRHRIHELTSLWVRPPSFLRPTEILVFSLNLAAGDYLSGLTVAHKTGRAKRGYTHTIYSLSTPATIKPIYIYISLAPAKKSQVQKRILHGSFCVLAGSTLQRWLIRGRENKHE